MSPTSPTSVNSPGRVKGSVNYCPHADETAFNRICFSFGSLCLRGENSQHLSNSCIELSGLSLKRPLQLLHCHFPMACYFSGTKLIGFCDGTAHAHEPVHTGGKACGSGPV